VLLAFQHVCAEEIAKNGPMAALLAAVDAECRAAAPAAAAVAVAAGGDAACATQPCELDGICLHGGVRPCAGGVIQTALRISHW
jgi:hypothetical protein